jgi:hypothetical protein
VAGARSLPAGEDDSDPAGFAGGALGAVVSKVTDLPILWSSPTLLAELI